MLSMYDSRKKVQRTMKTGAMGYVLKESAGREVVKAISECSYRATVFSDQRSL
jgi:DNA-binding NarL/FixJ family response regulator